MLKLAIYFNIILCISMNANAEIYKWKDEKGVTHYGDKPVASSEKINIKEEVKEKQNFTQRERKDRRKNLIESFNMDRKEKKEKLALKKQEETRLSALCGRSRDQLRRYERATNLYDVDKNGNRTYLSGDKHQALIKRARQEIKKYCR